MAGQKMSGTKSRLKTLVGLLSGRMEHESFFLVGSSFIHRGVDGAAVISFQELKPRVSGEKSLVLNAGISIPVLSKLIGLSTEEPPTFGDSAIQFRIEPESGDWSLERAPLEILAKDVFEAVADKLPVLRASTSLAGLRDAIQMGQITAISTSLRDRYLAFLAERLG